MITKLNLVAAGLFLAALGTGFGQSTLQFSASTYTVAEIAGTVMLTVQRTGDTTTEVTVDYATADGSATNGLKYTATNGTLAFAAGETNKTLVVPILNEGLVEGAEYFQVILSNPTGGAVLGTPATASVYITDNDTGLQFEFGSYSVVEDAGFVLLAVLRGDDGDFPVSVDYATTDGTAKSGLDYTGVTNTLFFAAGERVKTITVPILNDGLKEASETFRVTLGNPTNAVLGSPAMATVSITDPATAAPGSWTQKADMPAPTSTPASCVVDGILYIIGGHYQYTNQLRTVFAYDPQTDSWTRKKDMPTARRWPGAAVVDGIIYVISGGGSPEPPLKTVEAYDPKTDTWVTKADIPTGRNTLAACAVDGIIYAIGGFDYSEPGLATVEAYDPKTDQWTPKTNLPKGMYFATASVVDGLIYVFHNTDTFAYDPQTDRWTNKARFSPWSSGTMSVTVDKIIYLFGGMPNGWYGPGYDFALAYDPAQDRFTSKRKMPRTRAAGGCGVIDGKIYLAGGVDKEPIVNPGTVYWQVLDVFDPQGGVTPRILNLACESTNHVRLVWQGEAGLRYGVQSTPNIVAPSWSQAMFFSGSNSILATNALVEAICIVPTTDPKRFFRVLEL